MPKSVQSVIPIKTIWEDGIFLVGKNKYAKTFKFEDINYAVASREDKEAMFLEYSEPVSYTHLDVYKRQECGCNAEYCCSTLANTNLRYNINARRSSV